MFMHIYIYIYILTSQDVDIILHSCLRGFVVPAISANTVLLQIYGSVVFADADVLNIMQ